jgi:hypothetical protein
MRGPFLLDPRVAGEIPRGTRGRANATPELPEQFEDRRTRKEVLDEPGEQLSHPRAFLFGPEGHRRKKQNQLNINSVKV